MREQELSQHEHDARQPDERRQKGNIIKAQEQSRRIMRKSWLKLALCIIVSLLAGVIGGLFTKTDAGSWYSTIVKPSFNPPNWLFGPVWTLLYILMGISLYLAIIHGAKKKAKILFGTQLALNTLWSIIFFGMENPLLAFICIIILWIAILLTIVEFWKTSKTAVYLLMPYILWVTFASALNLAIVLLN
jgi:tryptophan-rich sensory protein